MIQVCGLATPYRKTFKAGVINRKKICYWHKGECMNHCNRIYMHIWKKCDWGGMVNQFADRLLRMNCLINWYRMVILIEKYIN